MAITYISDRFERSMLADYATVNFRKVHSGSLLNEEVGDMSRVRNAIIDDETLALAEIWLGHPLRPARVPIRRLNPYDRLILVAVDKGAVTWSIVDVL